MKRSPIKRRTPLRNGKPLKRGKRLNPLGPKGRAWADTRAQLKIEFEHVFGITACELRYADCWFDDALGFAHAAKRRKLSKEDFPHVILCCNICHDQLEVLPPEEMKRIVDETIQNRASIATD